MEINARNVNDALANALHYLRIVGVAERSRNGPVLVAPEPVMTVYQYPQQRVLFSPLRDANPFFHLMEALWMLAGRDDVEFPAYFAGNIRNYSDDGKILHGAYGKRWRNMFHFDQLAAIAEELKRNPETRRAVLQMWDADNCNDFHKGVGGGKDVPCNTHAYFDCRGGKLNMTVMCRSNDIWWGCYGANAVHFSILQEFIAAWVKVPMGLYRQFSNNWHLYTDLVPQGDLFRLATDAEANDAYVNGQVEPLPLLDSADIFSFEADLRLFFANPTRNWQDYETTFFGRTVSPMYDAWYRRKCKLSDGLESVGRILASDWRWACESWISRREGKNAA